MASKIQQLLAKQEKLLVDRTGIFLSLSCPSAFPTFKVKNVCLHRC